jgi:hypothetical protein
MVYWIDVGGISKQGINLKLVYLEYLFFYLWMIIYIKKVVYGKIFVKLKICHVIPTKLIIQSYTLH